jgi:hypothetical protein
VLRRIFGPKMDEVATGLIGLHKEKFHKFYSLPSIIRMIKPRRMKRAGLVARMGKKRNAYSMLGKPGGKKLLGGPRRKWVDNIEMDLKAIEWYGINWIGVA